MAITKIRISGRKFHQKIARATHIFELFFPFFFIQKGSTTCSLHSRTKEDSTQKIMLRRCEAFVNIFRIHLVRANFGTVLSTDFTNRYSIPFKSKGGIRD
jgi:hypothetical protein